MAGTSIRLLQKLTLVVISLLEVIKITAVRFDHVYSGQSPTSQILQKQVIRIALLLWFHSKRSPRLHTLQWPVTKITELCYGYSSVEVGRSSKLQRFTLGMLLQKKINQITEDKFAYNSTDRGHYIFIETSLPRRLGDTARLLSPILNANPRGACLRFWYHMYGPHINSLNVYTRPSLSGGTFGNLTKVWTKQHTQGNQWKFAEVAVASSSQYQASSLRLYLPFLKAWERGIGHLKFVSIDKQAKNGRSYSWEERHVENCICVLRWKFVCVCMSGNIFVNFHRNWFLASEASDVRKYFTSFSVLWGFGYCVCFTWGSRKKKFKALFFSSSSLLYTLPAQEERLPV